jgi:hypothetical protein
MNLLNNIKIWKKVGSGTTWGAGTAGGFAASTFIDMSNWGGCLFLMTYGSTCTGSSGAVTLQQSTGTSTGGAIASTFALSLGSTNRVAALDFAKPVRRYVRLKMLTGTGILIIPITYGGKMVGSTELLQYIKASSGQGVTRVVLGATG